jgi:hypothetical protein
MKARYQIVRKFTYGGPDSDDPGGLTGIYFVLVDTHTNRKILEERSKGMVASTGMRHYQALLNTNSVLDRGGQ